MDTPAVITDKTHPIEMTWIIIYGVIFSPLFALLMAPFIFMILGPILFFFACYTQINHHIPGFLISYIIAIPTTMVFVILGVKNTHYEFNEQFVVFKQGIISKSERHIPYARVQHLNLSQGLIGRWLGFATIRIGTAAEGGSQAKEIEFLGLLYKNALEIKRMVLERYKASSINDGSSGL